MQSTRELSDSRSSGEVITLGSSLEGATGDTLPRRNSWQAAQVTTKTVSCVRLRRRVEASGGRSSNASGSAGDAQPARKVASFCSLARACSGAGRNSSPAPLRPPNATVAEDELTAAPASAHDVKMPARAGKALLGAMRKQTCFLKAALHVSKELEEMKAAEALMREQMEVAERKATSKRRKITNRFVCAGLALAILPFCYMAFVPSSFASVLIVPGVYVAHCECRQPGPPASTRARPSSPEAHIVSVAHCACRQPGPP
eukprot:4509490-Prymnesium_polylepis.1